jgi:hypothetical protein
VHFQHSHSLHHVLVLSLLFIVRFLGFFFVCGGHQFAQEAMLVYPRGDWGNTV